MYSTPDTPVEPLPSVTTTCIEVCDAAVVLYYLLSLRYGGSRSQQPVAQPDNEFEKRLLLAKNKSKAMMPDITKIP